MNYVTDTEAYLGIATIIISILAVFVVVVFTIATLKTERQCLMRGWKDSRITWDLKGYCIREENEYEITVPLRELKNE